jgi:ATP-dependent DNA helicase DinG
VEAGAASVRAVLAALRRLAPTAPAAVVAADQRTLPPLHSLGEGLKRLCRAAELDAEGTASAAGLVAEAQRAIARAVCALRSDSGLWSPAWVSSAVQGRPSLVVRCAAPGRLLKRIWTPAAGAPPLARSVILTSASLATPGYAPESRWTAIQAATGVPVGEDPRVHRDLMVSVHPADYGELRARFADPAAPIPSPGADGAIAPEAARYGAATIAMARAAGGRVLVLTPAYADVEALAGLLPDALLHRRGLALRELLAAYRARPGACLVTPAAWEGVDLPGLVDQLVITRLPFPHRADLTGTETAADSVRGMLHRLTQGIGRGIRRPEDRVTVWFADPRMPPPTGLSARTLAVAHPRSSPLYLAAIPARFRRALDRSPEAAAFGVRLGDGPPRSPAALARRLGR